MKDNYIIDEKSLSQTLCQQLEVWKLVDNSRTSSIIGLEDWDNSLPIINISACFERPIKDIGYNDGEIVSAESLRTLAGILSRPGDLFVLGFIKDSLTLSVLIY